MFKMRTNFRNTLLTSLFVTRLYYSNLYSKIEQFVRFLRASYVLSGTSLVVRIVVVDCVRKLRL